GYYQNEGRPARGHQRPMDGDRRREQRQDAENLASRKAAPSHSACPMLLNISAQIAERAEDGDVVLVIGTELHPKILGDRQSDLENIDRIEPQAFIIERRRGIDFLRRNLQIQRRYNELRQLAFLCRLRLKPCHFRPSLAPKRTKDDKPD